MRVSTEMYIENDDEDEIELDISGEYDPGSPGCYTLSNGDPGYPPDPPSVDDIIAKLAGTDEEFELSEDQLKTATELLINVGETMKDAE